MDHHSRVSSTKQSASPPPRNIIWGCDQFYQSSFGDTETKSIFMLAFACTTAHVAHKQYCVSITSYISTYKTHPLCGLAWPGVQSRGPGATCKDMCLDGRWRIGIPGGSHQSEDIPSLPGLCLEDLPVKRLDAKSLSENSFRETLMTQWQRYCRTWDALTGQQLEGRRSIHCPYN